jgi:hypothetical protein
MVFSLRRSRFVTASAPFGTFAHRVIRHACLRSRHKIQTTTKPSDNLNYDRTTPGKGHTAAPIGRTAKYSVGSDAGRAHARLAVTTPLPGGVSALRYPTAQRPGSGRDSRNQPGRGKPEAPVGSPANERSNRTLVWGDTGSGAAEFKANDVNERLKLVRKGGFEKPLKRIFSNLQSVGTLSLVAKTL